MKLSKTLTVYSFGSAETGRLSGNWDGTGSTSNINPVKTKTLYLIFRSYVALNAATPRALVIKTNRRT
jgi:hypothetical protein